MKYSCRWFDGISIILIFNQTVSEEVPRTNLIRQWCYSKFIIQSFFQILSLSKHIHIFSHFIQEKSFSAIIKRLFPHVLIAYEHNKQSSKPINFYQLSFYFGIFNVILIPRCGIIIIIIGQN